MLYFVINPNARSGNIAGIWKKIEKELRKRRKTYRCYETKRKKDAVRIAKKLTNGTKKRKIVLLGGDGTLNEFLNGMQRTDGIQIGYLPLGSGNDFARGMRIGKNLKKELEKILDGSIHRAVDYGIVERADGKTRRFFVSSGIGYDAGVCYDADHSNIKSLLNRFNLGKFIYLVIGVYGLIRADTFCGTLKIDGKEVLRGTDFFFISFHNLPYEGGGFCFCPNARPEDGLLDVCAVKGVKKWKMPFIIPLAVMGKHIGQKGVYQFRCKEATVYSCTPQHIHADGETKKPDKKMIIRLSGKQIVFMN